MTPIPNADLYGSRVESFRYDLLDLRNQKVDELQVSTAVSGSLDFSTQANPQGSGSATITPKTPINWLQQRVRVWYLTNGGAANGGREVPLLTAIPKVPDTNYTPNTSTQQVGLFDCTSAVDDDRFGVSFALPAGTNIIAAVKDLIDGTGELGAVLEPSTMTLAAAMTWDASATKLRIVNDLLAAANYFALYADPLGRLRGTPYVAPTSRPNRWTFPGDATNLYTPTHTVTADRSDVPNKITGTSRALEDGTTWSYTATDTNPASQYSYANRGRWIAGDPLTDVNAASAATLAQIVTRRLSDAQQVQATYSITHPWLPFGLNDAVSATFPRRNETVRATCQRQTINLGEDAARVRSVLLKVA